MPAVRSFPTASMSVNAKKIRLHVINPPEGCREQTSLEHARRYVRAGRAEFVDAKSVPCACGRGHIRFIVPAKEGNNLNSSPTRAEVSPFDERYSLNANLGQSFLPYPQESPDSYSPRFPALARRGAGLG